MNVITRAIESDGSVTILELRRKSKLSQSGVYEILSALKVSGKIRRVGPTKGGYWELIG